MMDFRCILAGLPGHWMQYHWLQVFAQGDLVDANSSMPVIIALSSVEAEYMGDCNLGTIISQLQELQYEFEYLGTPEYKI